MSPSLSARSTTLATFSFLSLIRLLTLCSLIFALVAQFLTIQSTLERRWQDVYNGTVLLSLDDVRYNGTGISLSKGGVAGYMVASVLTSELFACTIVLPTRNVPLMHLLLPLSFFTSFSFPYLMFLVIILLFSLVSEIPTPAKINRTLQTFWRKVFPSFGEEHGNGVMGVTMVLFGSWGLSNGSVW